MGDAPMKTPIPSADIDDGNCEVRPGGVLLLCVSHDDDCDDDPNKWHEHQGSGWKLASFCTKHSAFVHPDDIDAKELLRKEAAGLAYRLDCYQHGGCLWSLHGEGTQCRWDTARGGGVLMWKGAYPRWYKDEHGKRLTGAALTKQREASARDFLRQYNQYINGDVYDMSLYAPGEDDEPVESVSGVLEDNIGAAFVDYLLPALEGRRIVASAKSEYDITRIKELAPYLAEAYGGGG